MVDFASETNFDLTQISVESVDKEIYALLIDGEKVISAYKTVRDQLVFTDLRMIGLDKRGITGKKKVFSILPYKMIQTFELTTVGLLELIPDAELYVRTVDGHLYRFEFRGKSNIVEIGKMISQFVLKI